MNKIIAKNFFATLLLLVLLFQDVIQQYIGLAKYFDEAVALISIIYLFLTILTGKIQISKLKIIVFPFLLYIFFSTLGTVIYNQQNFKAVAGDFIINIKFFMTLLATSVFFSRNNLQLFETSLSKYFIYFLVIILFGLSLMDLFFDIFPSGDSFGSLNSVRIFFTHETYYVAFLVCLISILFLYKKNSKIIFLMCLLMLLFSMKIKAILFIIFAVLINFVFNKKIKIPKWIYIVCILLFSFLIAQSTIKDYINLSDSTARGALLKYSFVNARNNFFGTGFGSYGCYFSGVYYSKLYSVYRIDTVWGMTKTNYNYIADNFWPMILGQSGFIGLICYFIYLINFLFLIKKLNYSKYSFVLLFVYLCISSIAETSFNSSFSVCFAVLMGYIFNKNFIMKNDCTLNF